LEGKVIHGQYVRSTDRQTAIGEEDTLLWLSRGDLEGETEREVTAAQDGVTNKITCSENITKRNRQQRLTVSTI
jgi:hypothetical protein